MDNKRHITEDTQERNFKHLLQAAEHQRKVRNCEIGGGVFPLEGDVITVFTLGLIQMHHIDKVLEVFKGTWGTCTMCGNGPVCSRGVQLKVDYCEGCLDKDWSTEELDRGKQHERDKEKGDL